MGCAAAASAVVGRARGGGRRWSGHAVPRAEQRPLHLLGRWRPPPAPSGRVRTLRLTAAGAADESQDGGWDSLLSALDGIESAEAERKSAEPQPSNTGADGGPTKGDQGRMGAGRGRGAKQPSRRAAAAAAWGEWEDDEELDGDAAALAFMSRRSSLAPVADEDEDDWGNEDYDDDDHILVVDEDEEVSDEDDLSDLALGLQSRWEQRAVDESSTAKTAPPLRFEPSAEDAHEAERAAMQRGLEEERDAILAAWGGDAATGGGAAPRAESSGGSSKRMARGEDGADSASVPTLAPPKEVPGQVTPPRQSRGEPDPWRHREEERRWESSEARRQRQEGRRAVAWQSQQGRWRLKKDWALMEMGIIPSLSEDAFDDIVQAAPVLEGYVEFRPMIAYLTSLGLSPRDLGCLAEARDEVFVKGRPEKIEARQRFLQDVAGLSREDFARVLCKFPATVTYKRGRLLKKLEFLKEGAGVAEEDLAKVLTQAPSVMGQSLEGLKQKTRFLCEVIGVDSSYTGRVIARDPAVLTRNIEAEGVFERLLFYEDLGLDRGDVGYMVERHPQVLRYSVSSMEPKTAFLREIGMDNDMVIRTVTGLPQVLGLDVNRNLRPKYEYLEGDIGGSAATAASFPTYFSLSLVRSARVPHLSQAHSRWQSRASERATRDGHTRLR